MFFIGPGPKVWLKLDRTSPDTIRYEYGNDRFGEARERERCRREETRRQRALHTVVAD